MAEGAPPGGMSVPDDGRAESRNQRLDRNWGEILQELRVTLTGSQVITGFLLAVAFQQRFSELDSYQLGVYVVLVALAALATITGLAPVVAHRALFRRLAKERVVQLGNRYLVTTALLVAVLSVGVSHLVVDVVLGRVAGLVAAVVAGAAVVVLWVLPLLIGRAPGGGGPARR